MTKLLTLAVLALSVTLPAQAQQQAGGNGHALDASQQVGSGGTNAATPQIDYRLRNNLVTGNVAGGRGFQGVVPYRAPGEFEGALGSDALFGFRAQSLSSNPNQRNNAGVSGVSGFSGGAGVYRSYTNLSGQSYTGSSSRTIYTEGGSNRLINPTRIGSGNILTRSVQQEQIGGTVSLNRVRTTTGQLLNVTDSPLLGVRQFNATPPRQNVATETQQLLDEQNRSSNQYLRVDTRLYQIAPPESIGPGIKDWSSQTLLSVRPTRLLGRQLIATHRMGTRGVDAEKLRDSIFNRKPIEGQSVYNALMKDVRQADPDAAMVPGVVPGVTPGAEGATVDLEKPADASVKQAEETALEAIRRAYGLDDNEDESEETNTLKTVDESIAAIMAQLNYDLPALNTLAGQEATPTNQLLKDAEAAMLADDFFKAESTYRQALFNNPNDPLAQVGLMHAQLGAGMIRSSALSLRRLFETHPELIAARYEARLLPNEQRLRWVQNELHAMVERPGASADPGVMLAYLGYQINSRQLVRYGLALAQTSDPRDPLLPVLRQIWLDEQTTIEDNNTVHSETPGK